MHTRFQGRLKKWNEERGFGFIVADDGGSELFVHISGFRRRDVVPTVGEAVSFEVEPDKQGKKRAVRVLRAGDSPGASRQQRELPAQRTQQRPAHFSVRGDMAAGYGHARQVNRTDRTDHWARSSRSSSGLSAGISAVVTLCLVAGIVWFAYAQFMNRAVLADSALPLPAAVMKLHQESVPADFRCDGRTMCSQMTSCREAKLFVQNCPGTQMDGNGDGIPCEQQWCTAGQ